MKKAGLLILAELIATAVLIAAQQPAPPAAPVATSEVKLDPKPAAEVTVKAPELTTTEKTALSALQQSYQQILQMLNAIQGDIEKNHPGWQLDPQSPLSGKLVEVPKPPAPPAAPEKAK